LLALEKVKREEGKIPDVLYYQIDGGPENTANAVFGIAELIILRGLAKTVVITRLPVGHTHEDIDSKFAFIWKKIRNAFVLTPAQYAAEIVDALTTNKMKCNVHDIFVVPDYSGFIMPYMDPKLSRYCKNVHGTDWNQLQFTFTSVNISDSFPLGVKMTYRKYSKEEVILIETSEQEGRLGFKVLKGLVTDQPEVTPENPVEGNSLICTIMYI
jgi:hypothetical protein